MLSLHPTVQKELEEDFGVCVSVDDILSLQHGFLFDVWVFPNRGEFELLIMMPLKNSCICSSRNCKLTQESCSIAD